MLTLRQGLKQNVLCWPSRLASAPAVLLLHGFSNSAHIWEGLAECLQNQYDVYAIDFRGHGDSDWDSEKRYTYDELIDDVNETIKYFGLEGCHLVGHSLGALVAILYNQRYRADLASLTIVDVGPEFIAAGVNKIKIDAESIPLHFSSLEQYLQYLTDIYLLADEKALETFAASNLKPLETGGYTPKTDPEFYGVLARSRSKMLRLDGSSGFSHRLWQALACVQAPTLVLRGQLSAILTDAVANKMAYEIIENGRLLTVPGAGHAVMIDSPEDYVQMVSEFVCAMTVKQAEVC